MEKINKYFVDWEGHVFGYGYGTGEEYTLPALKKFFDMLENIGNSEILQYTHKKLETHLGEAIAWLLINILCHADILEYGTSPRFGWLTEQGNKLHDYLKTKTADELYNLVTSVDESYIHCYPDHCNCEELGKEKCNNPFF